MQLLLNLLVDAYHEYECGIVNMCELVYVCAY